ncbi:response regulator [Prauserella muralis]|uniref:DNA-binding response regulator n=1 Tax=Prauserella muralis TaxID=588067 RepID=A0A2V4B6G2_9PSEU|nr:response regulator transcription factor [Prauserella muralis]PXY30894.1 DNA-binding response regulator [Prauserella muralis]TWE14859.1 LuxR family two component transcriptional regulator [Prauserella muralis]
MTEPRTTPVRVLLVDDDPLVCTGLRLLFRGAGDIEVAGEIGDGADVPDAVTRLAPDVVLMDVRMPYVDGIAATRAVRSRDEQGGPAVLVLTTFDTDTTVVDALRAGAAGYLLKHTDPEQLVDAVRRAAAGEPVVSPSVLRTLIDRVAATGADERTERARRRLALLGEREREVAVAVAEGLSNAAIAERLYLSVGTVKAHISSALAKLDLTNRIQLALLVHDADPAGH